MFRKVLIANRGEIAVRIIRTLREMGISSVAGYSDADRDALFVQEADEAFYLGATPAAESYLNIENILRVAHESGAGAIHPGYGFLSENAAFAEAVAAAGLTFIGPSAEAIRVMGDKVEARQRVQELGVPVVPGSPGPVQSAEEALVFAEQVGYPVAVKAAGGGGGRGIRVVERAEDMAEALERASREADTYFHNPSVYVEKYFPNPRHVEIQVLGDRLGNLVHLGERDCSVQRRHQKLIEETPSPAVDRELRARMGELALQAARSVEYSSAGTVEFLLSREGEPYFLEMNTRIQVEHPITEEVTGVDLIREMILAAAGKPITVQKSVIEPNGHAIEIRINAESPADGFRPSPAPITELRLPGGPGTRIDSGVYAGFTIPGAYDSLMMKLIVWAPDREEARRRALRALGEFRIAGPASTIPFAEQVLRTPIFEQGEVGTTFVEEHLPELLAGLPPAVPSAGPVESSRDERTFQVEVNRKLFTVKVAEVGAAQPEARAKRKRSTVSSGSVHAEDLMSPMHGTVVTVKKSVGEQVEAGETLFVVEAMKMENEVAAQRSGTIKAIDVAIGDTVGAGQRLAVIS